MEICNKSGHIKQGWNKKEGAAKNGLQRGGGATLGPPHPEVKQQEEPVGDGDPRDRFAVAPRTPDPAERALAAALWGKRLGRAHH